MLEHAHPPQVRLPPTTLCARKKRNSGRNAPTESPQRFLHETHTFPQETRPSPPEMTISQACVLAQTNKTLSQWMGYRHRDRDIHRRTFVVWESALPPYWSFRFRLHCGLSALVGWTIRLRASSQKSFFLDGLSFLGSGCCSCRNIGWHVAFFFRICCEFCHWAWSQRARAQSTLAILPSEDQSM